MISRTTSLLVACIWLSILAFCTPAQAELNVREHRSPDGRLASVIIENAYLGAEISSVGGKLVRLYDRRTGREFATQSDIIMQGIGKRRDWVTENGELLTAGHELTVTQHEPGRVAVEGRYEASSSNFAGLAFTVTYELAADRPALDVTHRATSLSKKTTFNLNIHNMFSLANFAAGSTYFYAGSADGPIRSSLADAQSHQNNLIYNVAEPWIAIGDRASGEGLVFILRERAGLENFYFWAGESAATLEWVYAETNLAPVAERDRWEASYSIVPTKGLGTLLGASPDLIYSVDQEDGQGRLGLFSPAGAKSAQVTLTHDGQTIIDREMKLSAFDATHLAFPLPAEAGVHEIKARVKMPGATVAFTTPVAVKAERQFAQATHEIRRPEVEEMHGFYYYFDRLSLSPDVAVPIAFGLRGDFPSKADLRLVIEVPKGVQITPELGEARLSEIEVEGKPYSRYELPSRRTKTYYSAVRFVAFMADEDSEALPLYYYAKWDGGEQRRQTLPLNVVSVEPAPRLEHIRVGLEIGAERSIENYPHFVESFNRAGLNYVAAGITGWTLGAEPRKPDGAYREFIAAIERAGITVSTGNIGYPFSRYHDVWAKRYGAYEIAGTLHYPKEEFQDFDIEDSKAVDINGEKITQMCPSYRGRFFDKVLDNVRLLIDYGYTSLLYDEETWGRARDICYCQRCRDRFADFLKTRYSQLEPIDPREIAAAPDRHAKLNDAWWDFRTDLVGEIYLRMNEVAVEHGGPNIEIGTYVSSSVGDGRYGAITQRMTDYRKVAAGADFLLPMYYTASVLHSRRVGDVAGFLWKKTRAQARPFMALSPARTYEYERVARHDLPPAVAIKYQMFEAISQGTQGILVWAPATSLEGALSYRYMADAVRAIAPVEDIIFHGELIEDPHVTHARVHARGIRYQGRSVLLVAEYSNANITTQVEYQTDRPRTVVDLETGETIAKLGPGNTTFEVTLDARRARLLLVE